MAYVILAWVSPIFARSPRAITVLSPCPDGDNTTLTLVPRSTQNKPSCCERNLYRPRRYLKTTMEELEKNISTEFRPNVGLLQTPSHRWWVQPYLPMGRV